MAETATMIAETPWHIRELEWKARDLAQRAAGRPLEVPTDDALLRQCRGMLLHRGCMEELEASGILRMMANLYALLPPPRLVWGDGDQLDVLAPRIPEDLPPAAQETWKTLAAWRDSIIKRWTDRLPVPAEAP